MLTLEQLETCRDLYNKIKDECKNYLEATLTWIPNCPLVVTVNELRFGVKSVFVDYRYAIGQYITREDITSIPFNVLIDKESWPVREKVSNEFSQKMLWSE